MPSENGPRRRSPGTPALAAVLHWVGRHLPLCIAVFAAQSALAAPSIVVGAKNFTEGAILAEIMAQAIESQTGLEVDRRLNLAGTQVCFEALRAGEIDVYAEYTGTALRNLIGDEALHNSRAQVYATVSRALARFDLAWLAPFGFENTYVMLVTGETSARLKLAKLSDLGDHPLRYGISHEFLRRPDGMPGLRRAYRLDEALTTGLSHDLSYKALAEGAVDVIDGYSTDAKILRYELVPLLDDLAFFPPYEAAPMIRADLDAKAPGATAALLLLAGRIDDAAMRQMNFEVEVERHEPAAVAERFLTGLGIGSDRRTHSPRRQGFLSLLYQRRWQTLRLVRRHLALTAGAVVLAAAFAIPLGIAASRRPALARLAVGAAATLQTIPSIALLVFMLPLFGIGVAPALIALFLYAILPILRNTVTGLRNIEERLIDVGRGLGMTEAQILRQVELPLAAPVVMAGIRTATVISVGTATLAAFIGAGGLGDPIVTGLATTDYALVLCGALPAAALAIALDLVLGAIERRATPHGLRAN